MSYAGVFSFLQILRCRSFRQTPSAQRRQAFTLVEMLVAVALTLFVMVLLSQAFTSGLEAFRQLKAIGDMEGRLRMTTTQLRRDLMADHFEGRKRLSDPNFFNDGPPREGFVRFWQGSPGVREGVDGDQIPSVVATDHILHFTVKLRGNGREDYFYADISDDPGAFRPALPPPPGETRPGGWALVGNPDSRYQVDNYAANPPTGSYASQWAEVAYFLRPNGDFLPTSPPIPLFSLYRRQLLVVPDNDDANWNSDPNANHKKALIRPSDAYSFTQPPLGRRPSAAYAEISCKPSLDNDPAKPIHFNNPTDLTVPQRRFGMLRKFDTLRAPTYQPPNDGGIPLRADNRYPILADSFPPSVSGSDVLLVDVISFEIKIFNPNRSPPDFDDIPPGNNPALRTWGVFDTWSSVRDNEYDYSRWDDVDPTSSRDVQVKRIPLRISIPAIKITLRVWDRKTNRARQVTVVQDM
jgi:type II secretory pathway pseudopilin PulG